MNHFTINGKVHKLGSMDIKDLNPKHSGVIKTLNLEMRDKEETTSCSLQFEMKFKMLADVNAIVVKVSEIYEQGYVSGWCSTGEK
jgi:hypothetical protein